MSDCDYYSQIDAYVRLSMCVMTAECGKVVCRANLWATYRVRCPDTGLAAEEVISCRMIERYGQFPSALRAT